MAETKKCPKCGKDLVIRKNKATGEEFLACSGYPACKYTEALDQKFVKCPQCGKETAKVFTYSDKKDGSKKTALACDACDYKDWNYKPEK